MAVAPNNPRWCTAHAMAVYTIVFSDHTDNCYSKPVQPGTALGVAVHRTGHDGAT
jgi:hypothetical protein